MTFLALCFALYFAPAMVASGRRHSSARAIWFTNFLLGWTLVGWVVCLLWALSASRSVELLSPAFYLVPVASRGWAPGSGSTHGATETRCHVCRRPIMMNARYCSMCGATAEMRA